MMHPNRRGVKGMPHWSDADYLAKLLDGVEIRDNGCWVATKRYEYKFKVDNGTPGYRAFCYRGKAIKAHRLSWILHRGPIRRGLVIMHKCDNPPCINPDHLRQVTRATNNRDMAAKGRYNHQKKTHCPHGHPYSGENLALHHDPRGYIFRRCRQCGRDRYRRQGANDGK